METKSQVSVEYLLVMGFVVLMTAPLLIVYYKYSAETSDSVAASQALQVARSIVDSAESVYYLGKPSQTTLKLNFPDKIQSASLADKELLFRIKTKNGITDVLQVSSVNISGTLPTTQGMHIVTLKAESGYVLLTSN